MLSICRLCLRHRLSSSTFIQGQVVNRRREYFYFISHEDRLFLHDARMKNFTSCFKEQKFLNFFLRRLRFNESDRYRDSFPFISLCQGEINYVACDDLPIVLTHFSDDGSHLLANFTNTFRVFFDPKKFFVSEGRFYHLLSHEEIDTEKYGEVALIKSSIGSNLSPHFVFNDDESEIVALRWKNETIEMLLDGKNEQILTKLYDRIGRNER